MYYAKWKSDNDYFTGMHRQLSWGPLSEAVGFASEADIKRLFKESGAGHWLPKIEVIFFHPFNLEQHISNVLR